jgi:thiamine biosynthesis lipoprotein
MHRVEQIMGMPIVVEVRDGDAPFDAVFDWFRRVDEMFSTYKPDSEISRVARGESPATPEVCEILARCDELRTQTNGYFDAYARGTLDPSGLVKGWAVDRAADLLDASGVREYVVNAGGDMRLRGTWRVGIQHPLERQAIAAVVEATDLALATSGEYARGGHVLDPHTGATPTGILSATISGPDLATADAYATAAFAMGARVAPHWVARLRGYGGLLILDDERVLTTPSFGCAPRSPRFAPACPPRSSRASYAAAR